MIEADESDRSLLKLRPEIAVLTNAELDHHATYASRLDLESTFRTFMARATGTAVVWDRPELRALCPPGAVAYDAPEPLLSPSGSRFDWRGIEVAARGAGRPQRDQRRRRAHRGRARRAPSPRAPRRRWPTSRARAGASSGSARPRRAPRSTTTTPTIRPRSPRSWPPRARSSPAAWWPSSSPTCTRARARWRGEFGAALAAADVVVVLPVYPARERAEDFPGVDGHLIAAAAADARGGRPVAWLPGFDDARRFLAATLRAGDLCLTMGAGDVDALGRSLVAAPRACAAAGLTAGLASTLRAMELPPGVRRDYPLARLTTIRTGGAAELFARPGTIEELERLVAWAAAQRIEVGVVGSGSNLLVADAGVRGLVVKLDKELSEIELDGTRDRCAAAARGCPRSRRGRPRPG